MRVCLPIFLNANINAPSPDCDANSCSQFIAPMGAYLIVIAPTGGGGGGGAGM